MAAEEALAEIAVLTLVAEVALACPVLARVLPAAQGVSPVQTAVLPVLAMLMVITTPTLAAERVAAAAMALIPLCHLLGAMPFLEVLLAGAVAQSIVALLYLTAALAGVRTLLGERGARLLVPRLA
jgi:hypothetical protein